MGPSGSGKTTLLSIMGCILTATSGSVRMAGREVVGLSEKQLPALRLEHIGFVFQGFNLFPTLTAGENVELMLDLKGVSTAKAKKRAQELLEQVGLAREVRELSGRPERRTEAACCDCAGAGRRSRNHPRRRTNRRARFAYRPQRDGDDERTGAQTRTGSRDRHP